jgi:hypothetical protein
MDAVLDTLKLVFPFTVLGLVVYVLATRFKLASEGKLPVRFRSFDEINCVTNAAIWAQDTIGPDDTRRKGIVNLNTYLVLAAASSLRPPFFIRISKEDLGLLAPFIDKIIKGEGPAWPLPAEYEDWRPKVLSGFKSRMQSEGLWPA